MYKSIADGFKVINATEGFKGFTLVSTSPYCHCQQSQVWSPQTDLPLQAIASLVSPDKLAK
jgi:hypothetical protein